MPSRQRTAFGTVERGVLMRVLIAVATGLLIVGCASHATPEGSQGLRPANPPQVLTLHVDVREGAFDCDFYLPRVGRPAPLVVVAHGFSRSKASMADWGRRLSQEGFAAAVPTLPAWSDHARNGRAISELADWLPSRSDLKGVVDAERVGLVGFSAGGLATLLAAADNPRVRVWVGLDPVDRNGQGAAAAARLKCPSLILRAEPHACNAHGNAAGISHALTADNTCLLVIGATHTDAEWPTDGLAEWVCGKSSPQRRMVFAEYTTAALRAVLLSDQAGIAALSKVKDDTRVKVLNQGNWTIRSSEHPRDK